MDNDGKKVGVITSGCPSPVLKKNIAMGYIATSHSKVGTECLVKVRGKNQISTIVKMPFVEHRYFRK